VQILPSGGGAESPSPKLTAEELVPALYETVAPTRPAASPLVTTTKPQLSRQNTPTAPPSTAAQRQQQGFGKMLYFLDQMKLEVTDADQKIKSLQTDMRCLVSGRASLPSRWLVRVWRNTYGLFF
jgi:hypothetical protein